MEPVCAQLRAFGARIKTNGGLMPVRIEGTPEIQTRNFILITPSAQIKSALLFAGLYAGVDVRINGDKGTRDHTERLLKYLGAPNIEARDIHVCGDFSAAAFFIIGATITPGSHITIKNACVNPTRTGLLDALLHMGADIELTNQRDRSGEPVADIVVRHAKLSATSVSADVALRAIDEIPVLSVAAAFADGKTTIAGIRELRSKESDRVAAIERMLQAAGIAVETTPNSIAIHGGSPVAGGAMIETHHDHRTAMATAVLACGAGPLAIDSDESIDVSFPDFIPTLQRVQVA